MNAISANSSYRAAQLQQAATANKHVQGSPDSPLRAGSGFSPAKALDAAQPFTSIIKLAGAGKPEAATFNGAGSLNRQEIAASSLAEGAERSVSSAFDTIKQVTNALFHKPVWVSLPSAPQPAQSAADSCGDIPFFTANDVGSTWCGKVIRPVVTEELQGTAD